MIKIRIKERWNDQERNIPDFVSNSLTDTYAGGAIEQVERKQDRLINAFGNLLNHLAKEGKLTAPQLARICDHFDDDAEIEFITVEDEDED